MAKRKKKMKGTYNIRKGVQSARRAPQKRESPSLTVRGTPKSNSFVPSAWYMYIVYTARCKQNTQRALIAYVIRKVNGLLWLGLAAFWVMHHQLVYIGSEVQCCAGFSIKSRPRTVCPAQTRRAKTFCPPPPRTYTADTEMTVIMLHLRPPLYNQLSLICSRRKKSALIIIYILIIVVLKIITLKIYLYNNWRKSARILWCQRYREIE